jgi:hypothetical protein
MSKVRSISGPRPCRALIDVADAEEEQARTKKELEKYKKIT